MNPQESFETNQGFAGFDQEIFEKRLRMLKKLQLLVVIVNRSKGKKVTEILRDKHMPGQFVFQAEGTASSSLLDMLGLGAAEKTVTLGFIKGSMIAPLLTEFQEKLQLTKAGTGIVFSIPFSGMLLTPMQLIPDYPEKWQIDCEREVEQMNTELTHDLIIVMVNEGRQEEVMEAARGAGARGGTTFHALHFGAQDIANFFGFPIQEKKDIVTILTKRENKLQIMTAINTALGASQKLIFALPADNVIGLDVPKA